MTTFPRRGWSPDTPCPEYAKLQRIAEELVANISETTSVEQFEQAQKSLLFLFQELKERLDPLHFRTPGGHPCLEQCYLEYAMLIRNRAILQKPLPPPSPPVPPPKPRSLTDVVKDFAGITEEVRLPDGDNGE
jgi:hypothetical protein